MYGNKWIYKHDMTNSYFFANLLYLDKIIMYIRYADLDQSSPTFSQEWEALMWFIKSTGFVFMCFLNDPLHKYYFTM